MFQVKASDYISMVRNLLVPEGWDGWKRLDNGTWIKPGVLVSLDCRLDNFDTGARQVRGLYFVLCGNTNTFAYQGDIFESAPPCDKFENISNHDTCWRDSANNFINKHYFEMAGEIGGPKAPVDLHQACYIALPAPKPIMVHFKSRAQVGSTYGERFELISISPRKKNAEANI